MELKDMIIQRKSTRSYTGVPVDEPTLEKIRAFLPRMQPLYPEIAVRGEIVTHQQVRCFLPWVTPQLVAIYTEDTPCAAENAGFLFQQLDLYLHSLGLGTCWLGMGRMSGQISAPEGMRFLILLAFGWPKEGFRTGVEQFKRKSLAQISDREDPRLEPARLAPSSVNSQPWYFTHEGDIIHAFCTRKGLLSASLGEMNRIDLGIALAHLAVSYPAFRFFRAEQPPEMRGCSYLGSFTL